MVGALVMMVKWTQQYIEKMPGNPSLGEIHKKMSWQLELTK